MNPEFIIGEEDVSEGKTGLPVDPETISYTAMVSRLTKEFTEIHNRMAPFEAPDRVWRDEDEAGFYEKREGYATHSDTNDHVWIKTWEHVSKIDYYHKRYFHLLCRYGNTSANIPGTTRRVSHFSANVRYSDSDRHPEHNYREVLLEIFPSDSLDWPLYFKVATNTWDPQKSSLQIGICDASQEYQISLEQAVGLLENARDLLPPPAQLPAPIITK